MKEFGQSYLSAWPSIQKTKYTPKLDVLSCSFQCHQCRSKLAVANPTYGECSAPQPTTTILHVFRNFVNDTDTSGELNSPLGIKSRRLRIASSCMLKPSRKRMRHTVKRTGSSQHCYAVGGSYRCELREIQTPYRRTVIKPSQHGSLLFDRRILRCDRTLGKFEK